MFEHFVIDTIIIVIIKLILSYYFQIVCCRVLNVPVTEHSYEDTRLMVQASKQNLPSSVGLVEYEKISTKLR